MSIHYPSFLQKKYWEFPRILSFCIHFTRRPSFFVAILLTRMDILPCRMALSREGKGLLCASRLYLQSNSGKKEKNLSNIMPLNCRQSLIQESRYTILILKALHKKQPECDCPPNSKCPTSLPHVIAS